MARALPLLLLVAVLALGWNLGGYRLLDPDEGRNAEVAREMARSNDYLIPHLDGLPYLDKPIVYFAAAAAVMEVLGPTETAARLPAYLATLATLALLVTFARRRWGPDAGWLAGLAFATMPFTLAYAHTAIFDSALTLCTTAAIIWFFEERVTLAWAALAVGGLTKGPVALAVPLVVVVPFALATGAPLRRLVSARGLAVFAVLTLPWLFAVTSRFPEFPRYVFVMETLQRFATLSFHRTAPWWFYLAIVPLATFPWLVPACARLARREPAVGESSWLALWVLAPLALFTLNHSKLPQYVLPLMPPLALAAARHLAQDGPRVAWRAYAVLAAALGVAFILLMGRLLGPIPLTAAEQRAIPPAAVALGIALFISGLCVTLAARRNTPTLGALGYTLVVISLPFTTARLMRAVGDDRSSASLATAIRPLVQSEAGPGATVLGVAAYPPSLPFYLGTTIAVATGDAHELTSNYIVAFQSRYRRRPDSPLKPAEYWRDVLAECRAPTVFVVHSDDGATRGALEALPLIDDDGRYAAYGPCRPNALAVRR